MNIYGKLVLSMIAAMLLAASAFAQTEAGKVAVINTRAFGADGGITRFMAAEKKLNAEFNADNQNLETLANRLKTLKAQLEALQKQTQVPTDFQKKADEYNGLVREYKFKEEDAQSRFAARRVEVMGPISTEILKQVQTFMLQKGYSMILDAEKLEGAGLLLGFDRKYDVTKDFMTFFNALPPGTASTQ